MQVQLSATSTLMNLKVGILLEEIGWADKPSSSGGFGENKAFLGSQGANELHSCTRLSLGGFAN